MRCHILRSFERFIIVLVFACEFMWPIVILYFLDYEGPGGLHRSPSSL